MHLKGKGWEAAGWISLSQQDKRQALVKSATTLRIH